MMINDDKWWYQKNGWLISWKIPNMDDDWG